MFPASASLIQMLAVPPLAFLGAALAEVGWVLGDSQPDLQSPGCWAPAE